MSKYVFLQPREVTTGDTVGYMNVIATDKNGYVDIINTGSTINTLSPDKNIVIGDVVTRPGDYKQVPGDLHVDGDIIIASAGNITIGAETIKHEAFLTVEGYINCTGTIDIQGTFFPGYAKAEVGPIGPAGTSGSSGSDGSAGQSGTSGQSGSSGESGTSGSSGENGSSGTSGTTSTTGTSGTNGSAGTGIPMTSMIAWYDATTGVTTSGEFVSSWDDRSGNNFNLIAPVAKLPDALGVTLNDVNIPNTTITYGDKRLVTASNLTQIGSTGTIFIVAAQYTGDGGYSRFIDNVFSDNFHFSRNSNNQQVLGGVATNDDPYGAFVAADNNTFYTFRLLFNGTTTVITRNGTLSSAPYNNGTPATARPLSMFATSDGSFPGKKAIAELIIYDDVLSEGDIATVESYLRTKWGHY